MFRSKRSRVKRYRAPRPVPPPKPPRPKRTALRNVYKDLISSDRDQRLEAIKNAMHWYDNLLAYLAFYTVEGEERIRKTRSQLAQLKAKSDAEKRRLSGLNSDKPEKKEMEFVKAIQCYERMTKKFHPPKIGTYLSKFSTVRSKLEKRKHRFSRKFEDFLELLDKAIRPKNYEGKRISLRVDKITSDYRVSSEGDITFDRKFLDEAKRISRKQGLLPGLTKLLPAFTEAAAVTMEKDGDGHRTGRYVIHGSKRHEALLDIWSNLTHYCLTDKSPKRLIRRPKLHQSTESTVAA